MKLKKHLRMLAAGAAAGAVNGLFGAGGGMVLVPLLSLDPELSEENLFPASIAVIFPICLVSLLCVGFNAGDLSASLPYLLGSGAGGILAGLLGKKIPVLWLHRGLGLMILLGGIRYLC